MNLETLIIIGLVLIIVGLIASTSHTFSQKLSNYDYNKSTSVIPYDKKINGTDPDKSTSTLFWGLFQNPNIFSDGWTFSEVSPNVYFKSTTLLNNKNHDPKL